MTTLEISRLSGPGRPALLDGVSLTVPSGTIAALFGSAQSGKRQLLRMICGLDPIEGGDVSLQGNSITSMPPHRRRVGVVLRDAVMLPGSVRANVAFGLRQQKWPRDDRERRVAEVLELVGLTGAESEPAALLTADERQRVALARALAPRPLVLLLESPTEAVDEVLQGDYRARLREILRDMQMTTLIFTEDLRDAVGIADDLHVMVGGRIVQSGSLSRVLAGPSAIEVAEMLGYVTLVRGEVIEGTIVEDGVGAVAFPAGFPLTSPARALAHPAAMLGVPADSGLGCGVTGTIERVRATGPTYLLDLRLGDRLVEVRWEWDLAPPPLDLPLAIAVTPGTLRFFNEPAPPPFEDRPDLVPAHPAPMTAAAGAVLDAPAEDHDPSPDAERSDAEAEPSAELAPVEADLVEPAPEPSAEPPPQAWREPEPPAGDDLPSVEQPGLPEEQDWSRPPSPAPAPPRSGGSSDAADAGYEPALEPWTSASSPAPAPPRTGDEGPSSRHQGMPLD